MEKQRLINGYPYMESDHQDNDSLKGLGVSLLAFLDTIRARTGDTYSVRLRITHSRKARYFSTKVNVSIEDYQKICDSDIKPRGQLRKKKLIILDMLQKANDIIVKMPTYSHDTFKREFKGENGSWNDVWEAFDSHVIVLKEENRYNYASSMEEAKNSFKKFSGKAKLDFTALNYAWLKKYENWMLSETKDKKARSRSTVGIYTRNMKVIYNEAVRRKVVQRDQNPFGETADPRYVPPTSRNVKKALSKPDLKKIFSYTPEPLSEEQKYLDLWIFSYLCNGMNISDILRLKYKNIEGDSIIFIRQKTSGKRNLKPVIADLSENAKEIVDRWGQKPQDPEKLIFSFLHGVRGEGEMITKIKHATKACNVHMKTIAGKIGIDPNISTYYARHSYATVLKLSGTDLAYISESLGHSNLQTTENYLSSFDSEARKKATSALTDFA